MSDAVSPQQDEFADSNVVVEDHTEEPAVRELNVSSVYNGVS